MRQSSRSGRVWALLRGTSHHARGTLRARVPGPAASAWRTHPSCSSPGRPAPACAGAARSAGVGGAAGRRAIMSIAHGALAGGKPHFSSNDAHLGRAQPLAVCVGRCASASNPPCNALRHLASPASPPADIAREAHVAWSRCRGGARRVRGRRAVRAVGRGRYATDPRSRHVSGSDARAWARAGWVYSTLGNRGCIHHLSGEYGCAPSVSATYSDLL